jgi:lysophospholipase
MGSFDPQLYGFAPLRYVGSNFSQGSLSSNEQCVEGFDNVGYVMGTSSSLFNQFILNLNSVSGIPSILKDAVTKVLNRIGQAQEDIADWSPNPFFGWNTARNPTAGTKQLTLVDGGEDLQNIPLHPLIQPARAVDVIFAVDSSADTLGRGPNWPNATALVATYQRSLNATIQNGTAFPSIPDQNTIVNLGLNRHPTFFGCNASNMTGPSPLIVYMPNAPYIFYSNISTFDLNYNNSQRDIMVRNGYLVGTMGNSTVDPQWPTCVGCAILSRSFDRTKTKVPDSCQSCFQRYCWNGTVDSRTPPPYEPTFIMDNVKGAAVGGSGGSGNGKKGAAAGLLAPGLLALFGVATFSSLILV